jgi:hypothetical protein
MLYRCSSPPAVSLGPSGPPEGLDLWRRVLKQPQQRNNRAARTERRALVAQVFVRRTSSFSATRRDIRSAIDAERRQSPCTTPVVDFLLYQRAAPSWNGRRVLRVKFAGIVSAAAGLACIISSLLAKTASAMA